MPFLGRVVALLWNAWWLPPALDAAYPLLFGSILVMLLSLAIAAISKRPWDRYWTFATMGLVLGFWLQR